MWSDMVDPFHNAKRSYYLTRGGVEGSWDGLPDDVILVNWNADHPGRSIRFFGDRGFRQIISLPMGSLEAKLERIVTVARREPEILGFQYTSWHPDYSLMPQFNRLLDDSALR